MPARAGAWEKKHRGNDAFRSPAHFLILCRTDAALIFDGNLRMICEVALDNTSSFNVIGREAERTDQTATQPPVDQTALWRLHHHSNAALHRISCELHDGALVLRGRLASYYLKQLAQAIVLGVEGVKRIENRIEVVRATFS